MQATTTRIAVIGGGISGLSTAYYLMERARATGLPVDITVYERKATLGGNAETVVVDLGRRVPGGEPYLRWADLGVNDVNLAAYPMLKNMMAAVGYLEHMKPLQNTECYWSADGRTALIDDTDLRQGVTDPAFSLAHADQGRLQPLARVVHRAALDLVQDERLPLSYTVGRFFQDCIDHPEGMLSRAANECGIAIDWRDPGLAGRVTNVRDIIYYPRISAMYFTDDRGPQGMPLQAPFNYYRIQEGGDQPDRRYFDHGSQRWLEHLANALEADSTATARTRIVTGAKTELRVASGRVEVLVDGAPAAPADLCIIATHADDARELLHFSDEVAETGRRLDRILAKVRYTTSFSVCHTYQGCMPPNKNLWRTYNVPVRSEGDTLFPYSIHYVVNLHQNDPDSPDYNQAGLPQYFVSLVSDLNHIPRQAMLDRVRQSDLVPDAMLAKLPQATLEQLNGGARDGGYRDQLEAAPAEVHDKAWTAFKHNVLDASCIEAQGEMAAYHRQITEYLHSNRKPPCPLLFAGGWSRGAGLHEQCLQQASEISRLILPERAAQ